jgi:hypothetical protein
MKTRDIVIVIGRCSQSKQCFGIRFERRTGSEWAGTWAFGIKDKVAKREGYEKARIDGQFSFDSEFPGCPHCSTHAFYLCSCGQVACMNDENRQITCPWCGQRGEVGGEVTSLDGGGDR